MTKMSHKHGLRKLTRPVLTLSAAAFIALAFIVTVTARDLGGPGLPPNNARPSSLNAAKVARVDELTAPRRFWPRRWLPFPRFAALDGSSDEVRNWDVARMLPKGASIDLKLLVISADGSETDFTATTAFLNQIGVPYDTLIATKTPLTAAVLSDGGMRASYQGIILCTGNLMYFNTSSGQWQSAFTSAQWTTLWQYEAKFGIRQVTSYTYPYGYPDNYGLNLVTKQDTRTAPLEATLTAEGRQVFPYLNAANPVTIRSASAYLSTPCMPQGCGFSPANRPTMTPLLTTSEGYVIASIASYPDGRENLAVTAENGPDLTHSLLLSYGIINWVTKGYFLGERHVNIDVQPDDILVGDRIWDTKALTDTTGLTYRMTGADLHAMLNWQTEVQARPTTAGFTIEWPFVGNGASGMYTPDTLTPAIIATQASFNWISHTYTHVNLDVATVAQTHMELEQNDAVAKNRLFLTSYANDALVQPNVSGLNAPSAFQGLRDFGIKYIIDDTSQPRWKNASPNVGLYSTYQPSILIIPRHPTNLFYNLVTPAQWVSEYNCYYAPKGTCAGGKWRSWDHDLSYEEILDKESEMWLRYLLKWDLDPLMFHQANAGAYDGVHSLLSDLTDATLAKYNAMYNLPIRNQTQREVGIRMAERMAYNASGVRATLVVGKGVILSTTKGATIPVTGISFGTNKERYGGQTISYVAMGAGQVQVLPYPERAFGTVLVREVGDTLDCIPSSASEELEPLWLGPMLSDCHLVRG